MTKVNTTMKNITIQSLKDAGEMCVYSISMTQLNDVGRVLDTVKKDIKSMTRVAKDVLIVVAVR